MLFNSLPFLSFFVIYFFLYLVTPLRYQLALIIAGSTIFYSYWNPYYIFLPHILTLFTYLGALWVAEGKNFSKKWRMRTIIILLLLPLLFIKYTGFIYNDALSIVFGTKQHALDFPLPLSISFVTFTLISYVVDVYYGRYKVEYKFSALSGLVLFFPHLIAGPILRPHELLPQLKKPKRPTHAIRLRVVFGVVFFTFGLLKKAIFADSISEFVDPIFTTHASFTIWEYWVAIYGFGLQIYCDFSGYTDMAIGLALLVGVRLPENFQHPYTSASIVEFWRRWHITLSNWLRDYLYIPLGGSRGHYHQQIANLLITMGIGGLWHGASWTFVLWGLIHGSALAMVHSIRRSKLHKFFLKIPNWFFVILNFNFVMFAWVFFRATDITTGKRIIFGAFSGSCGNVLDFISAHSFPVFLIMIFLLTHRFDDRRHIRRFISKTPTIILWGIMGLIWLMAILLNTESSKKFIYFDF